MTRIVVGGCWDEGPGYPRARSLLQGLRTAGFEVHECRFDAPVSGYEKRRLAAAPWRWPAVWMKSRAVRAALRRQVADAVARHRPDALLVPYPGHQAVVWLRGVFDGPIVLDLFLSAYDTAVVDRGLFRPGSLPARLLAGLDRRACRAADLVLLDTPQHARRIAEQVGVEPARFDWVPVSDPDAPVSPPAYRTRRADAPMEVLFFGTGVPLHGLTHLIEAMSAAPGVRLTLVGGGADDRRRAQGCARIRVAPAFVARRELGDLLSGCDLVAGIFADSPKAACVVPFKVVHGLAAGRPVLTADTPAVRELLEPGKDCIVCPPADPAALAETLVRVARDPDELARVAAAGWHRYRATFSCDAVAARLTRIFARVGTGGRLPRPRSAAECVAP